MRKSKLFINVVFILMLVLTALGNTSMVAQAGNGSAELKADPRLLQMAEENPDATFMVIVQREVRNKDVQEDDPEAEVEKEGGRVKKQFKLVESFSAELTGKQILKLAKKRKVRWISADAPMVSTASSSMDSVQDEFSSLSYTGNNGSAFWSTNWIEVGDGSGTTGNLIQPVSNSACAGGSGYCLRLDPYTPTGKYIYREANLTGMVSVWLSFYRNNLFNLNSGGSSEQVQLQISSNGGLSWTTLASYTGKSKTGIATESYDISAYASSNTRIRFLMPTYQSGTRHIYFDNIEIAFARPSAFLSTVKADQLGLNGSGVTVAVVDSGVAYQPDFESGSNSRILTAQSFSPDNKVDDLYGHGTHVAGIIGGNGAMSNGQYRGMATGVNLLNLKVADKDGMTYESDVVDAMQWVYDNKSAYNIRIVNISMNSTVAQSYHTSPLSAAVEILWFNGVVVVVSVGNNGTGEGPVTIYPPANDPFVITVGATEDKGTTDLGDDNLAVFSAYGLTEDGFAKPELVAPGRNVVAPLAYKASTVYTAHPLHRVGDYYFRMSGTSMSAPVVSGAVALLLQDEPNLTPDQVKYRLMATSNIGWQGFVSVDPDPSNPGYLDAYAAVYGNSTQSANQGITVSKMLTTGSDPITWGSVGWNSVGWNSVGWNSVGWNSVGWNASLWDN